jgi:hypothetical protein
MFSLLFLLVHRKKLEKAKLYYHHGLCFFFSVLCVTRFEETPLFYILQTCYPTISVKQAKIRKQLSEDIEEFCGV